MSATEIWMLAIGVGSLALELVALVRPQWLPLISPTMRADGRRWLLWPYLLGGLPGHFWSPPFLRWPALDRFHPWAAIVPGLVFGLGGLLGLRGSNQAAFLVSLCSLFYMAVFWSQAR